MIDEQNLFDQLVKNDLRRNGNIRKITTGQEDDYTVSCLSNYVFFKNYYKMIAVNLNKQQALDAIQQVSFTGNLE